MLSGEKGAEVSTDHYLVDQKAGEDAGQYTQMYSEGGLGTFG